jgi:hypothetical protein
MSEISETSRTMSKIPIPARLVAFDVALKDFYLELEKAVIQKAKSKGYYVEGEDSGRNLFDFIGKYAEGHSIGEIIYKAIRWTRKRDPEDLVKIAAWAFLTWDYNRRNGTFHIAENPLNKAIMGWENEIEKLREVNETAIPGPTNEAHSGSITCLQCGYVRSAHKYDALMNRYNCPVRGSDQTPWYFTTKEDINNRTEDKK